MTAAIERLKQRFEGEGLVLPAMPVACLDRCTLLDDWTLTSRALTPSAYLIDDYVRTAVDGDFDESIVIAHAGHGANSWALHLYRVTAGLAVFVQSSWGGSDIEDDAEAAETARFNRRVGAVDALFAIHTAQPLVADGERAVIVESDFGRSRWARWNAAAGAEPDWQFDDDALGVATAQLVGSLG